ncbi:hypothetical protein [Acetonema longum]|nr:hypothetical protein [Acetonema longum]
MMLLIRKLSLVSLLFCCFLLMAAPVASANVFVQVPSDYFVVMYAPNLENVLVAGDKVAQALKLPASAPIRQNAELEALRQSGLDMTGEMAFIMLDMPDQQTPDPKFVILARIKDRTLFNRTVTTDASGNAVLRRESAQPIYVQNSGSYAVLAMDPASLQQYRQRLESGLAKMTPEIKGAIAGNDATMVIQFQKVWPLVAKEMENRQAELSGGMLNVSPRPGRAGTKQPAAPQEIDPLVKLWLNETDTVLVGYKNGQSDVSVSLLMSVKSGGFAAEALNRYNATLTPGFAGLPAGKWAVAGFFADDPQEAEMYRKLTGEDYPPLTPSKNKSKKKTPPDTLSELISQSQKLSPLMGSGRYAWYVDAADPATGFLRGVYIIETSDATKLTSELTGAVKAVAAANRGDKSANLKVAEKISDVNFGSMTAKRIDLKFSVKDKSKGEPAGLDFLRQVNGSETVSLYLLPYDQHTFVLGIGNAGVQVRLAAMTLKTGISSLEEDPQLTAARRRMVRTNLGMLAVSPGRMVDAMSGSDSGMFEMMLGQPVVIGVGASGETIILRLDVPHTLLKMLFPQKSPMVPNNKQLNV